MLSASASTSAMAAAAILASAASWARLPEPMVIHWDAAGRADGFASRALSLSLLPALMSLLALVLRLPPAGLEQGKPRDGVDRAMVLVAALMLAVHLLIIVTSLEAGQTIPSALLLGMLGAFFVMLGLVMPSLPQNYLAGVRTPWSLRSQMNWQLTHRFGAWTMCAGGAVCGMISIAIEQEKAYAVGIGAVVVGALLPVGYSYLLHATQMDTRVVDAQEPANPLG